MKSFLRTFFRMTIAAVVLLVFASPGLAMDPNQLLKEGAEKYNKADYKGALELFSKGMQWADANKHDEAIGVFSGSIGGVYDNLGQYDKAVSYHQKSLEIHRKIGDVKGEGNDLTNIGVVYWCLGQYDKPLSYCTMPWKSIAKSGI